MLGVNLTSLRASSTLPVHLTWTLAFELNFLLVGYLCALLQLFEHAKSLATVQTEMLTISDPLPHYDKLLPSPSSRSYAFPLSS